jgi:hypothetical protein
VVNVDISIVATASRPDNWIRVYESIKTNLNIELVFVGPNVPKFQLPDNFFFIHSLVKPAQCVEIALREAKGKYVAIFADDLVFATPYGLDILKTSLEENVSEFDISSCRYKINGNIESDSSLRFIHGDKESPVVPIVGLMRRSALEKLGGIDKRFLAVSYDIDLAMRFRENGGQVFIQNVFVDELSILRGGTRLFNENWKHDREILNSFWVEGHSVTKHRKNLVEPFLDKDIRNYSQGPRGHWRGKRIRFVELIGNIPWIIKRFRLLAREYRNHI